MQGVKRPEEFIKYIFAFVKVRNIESSISTNFALVDDVDMVTCLLNMLATNLTISCQWIDKRIHTSLMDN